MSEIRAVVFDLDGALAKTANISNRVPATLLNPRAPDWSTAGHGIPGELLASGYRIAIVTDAPGPYAWTLAWLLRLDYELFIPGRSFAACRTPTALPGEKLKYLARRWDVAPAEVLFVSATEPSRREALRIGCQVAHPWWLTGRPAPDLRGVRAPIPQSIAEVTVDHLHDEHQGDADAGIDSAVSRFEAGTATETDYRLLLDREYHSVLVTYGDPHLLPPDLAAVRESTEDPPWSDSTDNQVWADLLRTGDVGRLHDMQQGILMFRLPDSELNAVLAREAAAGAHRVVLDTLSLLAPELRSGIATPPAPPTSAERRQRRLESVKDSLIVERALDVGNAVRDRLRVALGALAHDPGHPGRRGLQKVVFSLLPPEAGECLITAPIDHDWLMQPVGLPRWLVTRAEYDSDNELRALVLARLAEWFPVHHVGSSGTCACVSYSHAGRGLGSDLWRRVKDWHGKGHGSGPAAELEFLELPALVLAGHVNADGLDAVVPVPSSAYGDEKPAQASLRLAQRVARLAGVPLVHGLSKSVSGTYSLSASAKGNLRGLRVALVDDQATSGRALHWCRSNLTSARVASVKPMSWSASGLRAPWAARHDVGLECWLASLALPSAAGRLDCQDHPR